MSFLTRLGARSAVAALVVAASAAAPAAAQTTHVVQLFTVSFSPNHITIQEGDTVRWEWVTGFHDVKSGSGGVPDGAFDSGSITTAPNQFEVTFDAAFLAAHPQPNDVYPFYCSVHLPVMVGSVTVQRASIPASVTPYGSGMNPAGSLVVSSGEPKVGQAFSFGVSNTISTSEPVALAVVLVALEPDPNFPNGTPLPGFGLAGPFGELLIGVLPPNPVLTLGPVLWLGGANPPAQVPFGIPADPALAGLDIYFQGALLTPDFGWALGLTNGLHVVVGS